jgi:hypothetical protein
MIAVSGPGLGQDLTPGYEAGGSVLGRLILASIEKRRARYRENDLGHDAIARQVTDPPSGEIQVISAGQASRPALQAMYPFTQYARGPGR